MMQMLCWIPTLFSSKNIGFLRGWRLTDLHHSPEAKKRTENSPISQNKNRLAIQGSCSFAQGVPELLRAVSRCLNQGRSMLGGSSESSRKGDDVLLAALTQLRAALRRGMGPVLGGRWLGFYSYLTDRL